MKICPTCYGRRSEDHQGNRCPWIEILDDLAIVSNQDGMLPELQDGNWYVYRYAPRRYLPERPMSGPHPDRASAVKAVKSYVKNMQRNGWDGYDFPIRVSAAGK